MKILHVMIDWWLCDSAIDLFETLDCQNTFVILLLADDKTAPEDLKHIKDSSKVLLIREGSEEYRRLLEPNRWDVVWMHGLYDPGARFVVALEKRVKVFWTTWGIDYLRLQPYWMYGPRTTLKMFTILGWRAVAARMFFRLLCIFRLTRFLPLARIRFLRRVDYFSCTVPQEEPAIRMFVGNRPKRLAFHCVRSKPFYKESEKVDLSGKNIVVGHAALWENNHFDIYPKITCEGGYQVWSPLSYTMSGVGVEPVTQVIANYGKRCLGDKYHPIFNFMPIEEYRKWTSSCSCFVYANIRPQALGNVIMALRSGGCVFMHPKNPIYQYFKSNGFVIYPLDRIKEGFASVLEDFAQYQQANIDKIASLGSHEQKIREVKDTIEYIKSDLRK